MLCIHLTKEARLKLDLEWWKGSRWNFMRKTQPMLQNKEEAWHLWANNKEAILTGLDRSACWVQGQIKTKLKNIRFVLWLMEKAGGLIRRVNKIIVLRILNYSRDRKDWSWRRNRADRKKSSFWLGFRKITKQTPELIWFPKCASFLRENAELGIWIAISLAVIFLTVNEQTDLLIQSDLCCLGCMSYFSQQNLSDSAILLVNTKNNNTNNYRSQHLLST
jgi:hypothetical protein